MDGASTTISAAEGLLRALKRRGVDYVLANAGTDFAPIIEGLVRAAGRKDAIPRFITVPHENLAVAMAHGYYQVAGKPAGVMVHVTVGTGNTICALMNAARDNVPLLLMAGRTPLTQDGHIASRSAPIHWGQENFDQGGITREYTKWDFELRAGQPVDEIVGRALDIALIGAAGARVSHAAARGARESAQGQHDAAAADRDRNTAAERAAHRYAGRVDRGSRVSADSDVESGPRLGRSRRPRGARRAPRDPGRAAACELRQFTREPRVQLRACRHGTARQGRPPARGGLRGTVVPALCNTAGRREGRALGCRSAVRALPAPSVHCAARDHGQLTSRPATARRSTESPTGTARRGRPAQGHRRRVQEDQSGSPRRSHRASAQRETDSLLVRRPVRA